ncbi:BatD family protein [Marixanthomonas spongiae]|nr:BatD family protein [Marixanthomonas spongiae]
MKQRHLFVSVLFLFFSFVGFSQVTSSVDSTSIKIGEEIVYSIQVETDSTNLVVFPEGQTFMPLEVIESYKIDTTYEQAKYRLIKKYGLTQFDSGQYTIPQQQVVINNKQFGTDSVSIEVRDVAVDTTKQKMFDIKPAIEVDEPPLDLKTLLLWLIPIVIVLSIVGYILFRRKKRKDAREEQLPPYEEAITALHTLDSSTYLKENKPKEYYSQLTEIVKRYLDREVDETALESTSDELIARLQLHKDSGNFEFSNETIRRLDAILKRADLVKFAKMYQAEGQASTDRKTIEEIINETKEVIPEPTEEELQENAEYQEAQRKKRVRRKWAYAGLGVLGAVLIAGAVYGGIKGFDDLKDLILGNDMRELAESRWIKSEYGDPAVIIETPEVLVRTDIEIPESQNMRAAKSSVFTHGEITDPLYVWLNTTMYKQQSSQGQKPGQAQAELEPLMDQALTSLEKRGAKNLMVKRESFETQKGITGIKAYGKFNIQVSDNKVLKKTSNYVLLLFAQKGGVQQVLVVYQEDDGRYAEDVKNRIINSVELEISEK